MLEPDVNLVQRHWNSRIAKNYKETMSETKKVGKKPKWMSVTVWKKWVEWWNSEEFKVNLQ